MSRNRDLGWALVAIGAFGVSFAISRIISSVHAQSNTPAIRPFTLTTELFSPQSIPPDQPFHHVVLAVRADGARSTTENVHGRKRLLAGETVRAVLFPDGTTVSIFPFIAAKTSPPHKHAVTAARAISRLLNPPPDCAIAGSRLVGYDTVGGWRVAGLEYASDALGSYVIEWDAPELGCTKLQYKAYERQPDGKFRLGAEGRFVKVELGQPDSALFDVPTDYQEMKPSDVVHLLARRYNETLGGDQEKFYEDQDRAYLFGDQGLRPNGRYWRDALPAPRNKFR